MTLLPLALPLQIRLAHATHPPTPALEAIPPRNHAPLGPPCSPSPMPHSPFLLARCSYPARRLRLPCPPTSVPISPALLRHGPGLPGYPDCKFSRSEGWDNGRRERAGKMAVGDKDCSRARVERKS
ncbi:hypothetical protein C8Q76DRAFT_713890 [Earliella scabrosa]|nr:hypothetical protein C8Q76DRAFT_713890 [Earliella scabrosa]